MAEPAPRSGAPSLRSLAIKVAVKHVDQIENLGDLPLDLVSDIVKAVSVPEQLHVLQQNSPQIMPITPELWKAFIRRDIPNGDQSTLRPKNPKGWFNVYQILKQEDAARLEAAQAQLKASLSQHEADRAGKKTLFLNSVLPGRFDDRTGTLSRSGAHGRQTLGGNALRDLRKRKFTSDMQRFARRDLIQSSNPSLLRAGGPSKISSIARSTISAPRMAMQHYVRDPRTGTISLPGANPHAPIKAPQPPKQNIPGARNPFQAAARRPHSRVGTNLLATEHEALELAVRLEKADLARQAEKLELAAQLKAGVAAKTARREAASRTIPTTGASNTTPTTGAGSTALRTRTNSPMRNPSSPVRARGSDSPLSTPGSNSPIRRSNPTSTTPATGSGKDRAITEEHHKPPPRPPTAAAVAAATNADAAHAAAAAMASTPAPAIRRKAPNVFMAPSKRIKRG